MDDKNIKQLYRKEKEKVPDALYMIADEIAAIRIYKQARADERKKILGEPCSACEMERREKEIIAQGKAHAEQQYTEGFLAGQRSKTAYKLGKMDGQVELIEKLKTEMSRRIKGQSSEYIRAIDELWGYLLFIEKASESAGCNVAIGKPELQQPHKAKPDAPEKPHENGKSIVDCGCKDCIRYREEIK